MCTTCPESWKGNIMSCPHVHQPLRNLRESATATYKWRIFVPPASRQPCVLLCFVICSASTVGRTQQEAARGSGFGTNWKRCACRAHPDAKPSPSQKNLLAPHAVGCTTSMAGLHTWIWDIQFHQFHEIHQLILTQCISMYLNVSQCISMHLNASQCDSWTRFDFHIFLLSHQQLSVSPGALVPCSGAQTASNGDPVTDPGTPRDSQGLPGTPRDLAMACNGLQWHHGCVQVLRLGALQLPDQVFSTFLHQIMEKVMFHGFMEKIFSELMSSKVGNPPVTTRRFLGSSFKALSLDWSDLICAFHPRQAIGLDESLKSADTHTSNKNQ